MRLTLPFMAADGLAATPNPAPQGDADVAFLEPEQQAGGALPGPMVFDSDAGAFWPTWLAGILCLLLTAWMASGLVWPSAPSDPVLAEPQPLSRMTVAVRPSRADKVKQYFRSEGHAVPDRETAMRAEMPGHVAQVHVQKGQVVAKGDLIAQLDPALRAADLSRAQEDLARALREFETAEALLDRGASTAARVSQARAALAAAHAGLSAAQQGMAQTRLVAPFGGRVETLTIDPGVYVQEGAELARIVDTTPLTVSLRVPQLMRGQLRIGAPASVRFITGEHRSGEVTFLGGRADVATRTFLAEISVPNADDAIPAGISARIEVPLGEVTAHFLSPAILSLSKTGVLGIKTVDHRNRVVFTPVEIAQTQSDGIWVTGLGSQVRLITVGQGFVTAGETVIPRLVPPVPEVTK
jgi:multidrug efflux system membrane fusion protein